MLALLHPALFALVAVGLAARAEHQAVNLALVGPSKARAGRDPAYHVRLASILPPKQLRRVSFARSALTKAPAEQEPA